MTQPSLRSLLEDAEAGLRTYRFPDVSEAQERLNEVLEAAGLRSTGTDRITRLGIGAEHVYGETAYSVRGCESGDDFEFPAAILDAPDPVRAATLWGLGRRRAEALGEIERARLSLAGWEADLAEVESRLAAARARGPSQDGEAEMASHG